MKEQHGFVAFQNRYEGQYNDDKFEGHGVFTWLDGNKYDGQWKNDKQHGLGIYKFSSGDVKKGKWCDGKLVEWISE